MMYDVYLKKGKERMVIVLPSLNCTFPEDWEFVCYGRHFRELNLLELPGAEKLPNGARIHTYQEKEECPT